MEYEDEIDKEDEDISSSYKNDLPYKKKLDDEDITKGVMD